MSGNPSAPNPPGAPVPRFSAQAIIDMSKILTDNLEAAVQDSNGGNVYNNIKVMAGHIEASKYMLIPRTFDDYTKATYKTGLPIDLEVIGKRNGLENYMGVAAQAYTSVEKYLHLDDDIATGNRIEFYKIAALNFMALKDNVANEQTRIAAALFRARWCVTGAYRMLKHAKDVGANEYVVVDASSAVTWQSEICSAKTIDDIVKALGSDAQLFVNGVKNKEFGLEWVLNVAENVWCAVEHCFRVRSHHFKSTGNEAASYKDLYDRYLNACYQGDTIWPVDVNHFDIFHTAIHPFKVECLPKVAVHYIAHGLVADAAIVRFSGAPCGHAAITTTQAALDTMSSEIWFDAFTRAYEKKLEMLKVVSDAVLNNKYAYHIAAGLYGMDKKVIVSVDSQNVPIEEAKSNVSAISAAAQGLISALKTANNNALISKFALSNAKALEKPAAQNPLLALRISLVVVKALDDIGDAKDLTAAINIALPNLLKNA